MSCLSSWPSLTYPRSGGFSIRSMTISAGSDTPRPNIVTVVADCATASDLFGENADSCPLPFVRQLLSESLVCERTVSTSPWTLPSHASILTGLYPWEHHVHRRASIRLSPRLPTLPLLLRERGYASFILSGNPILSDATGLTRQFDAAAWARPWEKWIRFIPRLGPHGLRVGPVVDKGPFGSISEDQLLSATSRWFSRTLNRHSFLSDLPNELIRLIHLEPRDQTHDASPWIEPLFRKLLRRLRPSEPFFSLINLFDAHEPFLPSGPYMKNLRSWLQYARIVQDNYSWATGEWNPDGAELAAIRGFYLWALRRVDHRIASLVTVLKEEGRWDDTLFILTADHGQSFGQDGAVFHPSAAVESLMRVPLLIRYPKSRFHGYRLRGWTSVIDIPTTILHAAGVAPRIPLEGEIIDRLPGHERESPVFAFVDGGASNKPGASRPRVRGRSGDFALLAYYKDRRFVLDLQTGQLKIFDASGGAGPSVECGASSEDRARVLAPLRRLESGIHGSSPTFPNSEVSARLASWGYA
jgi:arylsulfatase A-like enzyme